ncbi:plasmid partitioning protein RepB C-terminal domain-containing protein [Cognatiyoonia sp. IB215446]|uniref:plasmid partitioning protein RepB C-terminal domain-containing protein n=1 Tax=Cognatiyoonia sp. IB215446 TaxID=3097355 RepID=UPI002A14A620|nr:plasmid partitioning protein RepB C-terminal domain-containing protein [Cognatiyoonia sp. IB215446]MDX8347020.1 plasmid partitioning protein RepB C-terminal domain-containing protein [Cognatiyoonia sp. IB215446]
MSDTDVKQTVLVPIDAITVVNPRVRNQKVFEEIKANIAELGLKRPITVAVRETEGGDEPKYELVCGQGRMEAFKALGKSEIPAIVISASSEDCLVMSLVENLARRQHHSLDLLRDIRRLKESGYPEREIAAKTQLSAKYVQGVIKLLEGQEHRLLRAVESGKIPVSVAVDIADADDVGVQTILRQAYEKKLLRGGRLLRAKRLVEARQKHGKGQATSDGRSRKSMSVESLLKTYENDVEKKKMLLRKAHATRSEMLFLLQSLKALMADENFVTLLRAEGLASLPKTIADRLSHPESAPT